MLTDFGRLITCVTADSRWEGRDPDGPLGTADAAEGRPGPRRVAGRDGAQGTGTTDAARGETVGVHATREEGATDARRDGGAGNVVAYDDGEVESAYATGDASEGSGGDAK